MEFQGRRLRRNEENLDSVICRFGFRQALLEKNASRSAPRSVISSEDRDKILREFGSYGERENIRRPERRIAVSQDT
jgi:hypothetical protein